MQSFSQENLGEKIGFHYTYIGAVERRRYQGFTEDIGFSDFFISGKRKAKRFTLPMKAEPEDNDKEKNLIFY